MHADLKTLAEQIGAHGYIADEGLLTNLWLMQELGRPLLLEGDAGVGKTQLGKTMAAVQNRPLIRLQCYEGLDVNTAVYEWNYQRQLISIRRSDEAFLLELLSDFQISIPELGTVLAKSHPMVILTSNGTRELSDALRRRCLYHYIDYPSYEKELSIVKVRIPDISDRLASQVVSFVQSLRREDLRKIPGIAETLDWTAALMRLDLKTISDSPEAVLATLGCLLKTREDHDALPEVMVQKFLNRAP